MSTQYQEHLDCQPDNSRWDGYCRGDQDFDYEAAQQADNERDEELLNAI